jgi:hypothetical protein
MPVNASTPLGVDPGNGAIKLYGPHGGLELPAYVATRGGQKLGKAVGLGVGKAPLAVATAGGSFYVGPHAHGWGRPVENMDHDRFAGSPELGALLYAALTQYAQLAQAPAAFLQRLDLTVGLPLERLTGDEEAVKGAVAAVRRWLVGEHAWQVDSASLTASVSDVAVTSQPVGALFDFLLDAQGAFLPVRKALFRAEVGVLSVGMNTVELLAVRGGQVAPGDTYAERRGVRRLLELCNPDGLYSLGELDAQLRAGRLDSARALAVWDAEVGGLIERRWGAKHQRFAAIILVGGGVKLLGERLLARFGGKAWVPDEPVLATARGLYKLVLLNARKHA